MSVSPRATSRPVTSPSAQRWTSADIRCLLRNDVGLIVKGAIVELAETLMFAGVVRRDVVGEPEEEVTEGFSRDEVEARFLDTTSMWSGSDLAAGSPRDPFHLFESVYDRGVKFVLE